MIWGQLTSGDCWEIVPPFHPINIDIASADFYEFIKIVWRLLCHCRNYSLDVERTTPPLWDDVTLV